MKGEVNESRYTVKMTIPLMTKPEVPNINGKVYTEESYLEALTEYVNNIGWVLLRDPNVYNSNIYQKEKWNSINTEYILGVVQEVREDEADILVEDEEMKYHIEYNKYLFGLRYTATKREDGKYDMNRIIAVDLLPPNK